MINLLYILFLLLSGSIFISLKFNKPIEKTIIINLMLIIFLLYIFGLMGFLKVGVYFIGILSLILMLYSIILCLKKEKNIYLNNIVTPSLVIFIIIYFILIFMHRGRLLIHWDEFSHWGDVVKAMFTINDFATSSLSMSEFRSYPPAMSLFQYFFESVNGRFVEYHLYLSYQIFGVALFLPFLSKLNFKKPFSIILSFFIIILIPTIFYTDYYTSIYIDAMVGMVFAYNITLIYKSNNNVTNTLSLGLSLFILVLLKDVGLLLAIITVFIFILNILYETFKNHKFCKLEIKKNTINICLILAFISFAKISWSLNIIQNNVISNSSGLFNIKELINIFLFNYNDYRLIVIKNYVSTIFNVIPVKTFIINLTYYQIPLFFAIIYYLLYKYKKKTENPLRFKFISSSMVLGCFLFFIGLLFLYIIKFSEYEAIRLASMDRYIYIYFTAMLAFLTFVILDEENSKLKLFLLTIVLINCSIYNFISLPYTLKESISIRKEYQKSIDLTLNKVHKDDKVYIVSQNTQGYDYWVLRFSLRPIKINDNFSWSIGKQYYDGDIWTKSITVDEWENELKNKYDYVLIYKCDQQFIDEFGKIFDGNVKSNSLYKIIYIDGKIKLEPVNP